MPTKPTKRRAGKREYVVGYRKSRTWGDTVWGCGSGLGGIVPFNKGEAESDLSNLDADLQRVIYKLVHVKVVKARRSK